MPKTTKRTLDQVLDAIKGSGGVKAVIAQRLNVTRMTLDAYLRRWQSAANALEEEKENTLDTAETVLITQLRAMLAEQRRLQENGDYAGIVGMQTGLAERLLKMRRRDEYGDTVTIQLDWGDS